MAEISEQLIQIALILDLIAGILQSESSMQHLMLKTACRRFKKIGNDNSEDEKENKDNFASAILKKKAETTNDSNYSNCLFIQCTSNALERFFSSARYAASEIKQKYPGTFRTTISEGQ